MSSTSFDQKKFNSMAFGKYVDNIPNPKKNALAKSKAVGGSPQANTALSDQSGSLYARVPYFGNIKSSTSQNNDGMTDIETSHVSSFDQGFITVSRMDAWTERDFSTFITAGVDFMDNVASQLAEYKMEVKQDIILAVLEGIYSMNCEGDSVVAKANASFIENHSYDVTGEDDGTVRSSTLNKAIQRAGGDNKNIFRLAIMHSMVATNLENLKLLKYMTQTDSMGIEQDLTLATWNGRIVLIDDNMPVISGNPVDGEADEEYYITYVLGENAIIMDLLPERYPYVMTRDELKNGGQTTLVTRDRYYVGVNGISFDKPSSLTASATNVDLANGENWNVISDGVEAVSHKIIPITRIISKGWSYEEIE
ncbi:MAG: major capsid protein [Bacillota bacterium]